MRNLFKFFSVLDAICLLFLAMQFQFYYKSDYTFISLISEPRIVGQFLTFILISLSCIGQSKMKKIGHIAYYIQFPARLILFIYSIGFVTLFPEALGYFEDFWFDFLLGVCVLFEFLRLYFTIRYHKLVFQ